MTEEIATREFPPAKDVLIILLLTLALTFFIALGG